MTATIWNRFQSNDRYPNRCTCAAVLMVALAAACVSLWPLKSHAAQDSLLGGRVKASSGAALAGIPVRAHRENSNVTVSVYTNGRGEYSFPGWSDLSPGSYSVAIELPEFVPAKREAVALSAGKTTQVEFALQARQPTIADAGDAEIAMAMPGTEEQKFLLTQCGQCHSLQFTLRTARTREGWYQIIKRMGGAGRASEVAPGTRDFMQKPMMEALADYLASIRGPGSSGEIPFKLRPRPTSEASTRIVVTEYGVPRGGENRDLYITRGDRRFSWPHDVLVDHDGQYLWYTDHFTNVLGRLDKKTGEIKEFPFTNTARRARGNQTVDDQTGPPDERPGNGQGGLIFQNAPGGAHKISYLPDGDIIFGTFAGEIIFNPKTEEFKNLPSGSVMFGIDPSANVWYIDSAIHRLDPKTGEVKSWPAPPNAAGYDVDVDAQGRFLFNGWRTGKIGMFDPKTEKITDYPVPTPGSGPRRGKFDSKNRYWVGLYWAGRLARFDPNKGEIKEYPLIPDVKPFAAPYLAPYNVAVDDKNQLVWTSDFNSSRIYRFDMKTEKSTEFFMPAPYEVRNLAVDNSTGRVTVWIPAYRPPSKIVKMQLW